MKGSYRVIVGVLLAMACAACAENRQHPPVSAAAPAFVRGADISLLADLERRGVQYKDAGQVKDGVQLFKDHGFNTVRLRLFVDPNGRGGAVNTLAYTIAMAQRVKRAGMAFMLDYHYSDTWADPGKQTMPDAWKGMTHEQLVEQVYQYTRETMEAFASASCLPDMVQVGNEITNGMLWMNGGPFPNGKPETKVRWKQFGELLKAAIRGVRACPGGERVRVILHVDRGGRKDVTGWFFDHLAAQGVDFDVIGLSYYPFWGHATLEDLRQNLALLATKYGKDVMVVETGYDRAPEGGKIAAQAATQPALFPYPQTPEGQKAFLEALVRIVTASPRGKGVCYWQPEWVAAPGMRGGGASADRALFDENGNALPGLDAFREAMPIK